MRRTDTARILRKNETASEKILWDELRGNKLLGSKFRRQHPLNGYFVDFYCHEINLVIEIDGSVHDNNKAKDEIRQNEIVTKTGSTFLRFTNEDVLYRLKNVLEIITNQINTTRPTS